jgi:intracellular septation protein
MSQSAPKLALSPFLKLALDLGPLVVFFLANSRFGIFTATAIFMAAVAVALVTSWVLTRHLPVMTIVTAVVVAVFGTLTLVLHDETFIKVKPTMIYAVFGVILAGGLMFGRSFIAILFESVFNLTAEGWRKLTIRWAAFFFAMAILNEIVWRTQTTDFWVAFKLFGAIPLTFVFGMLQLPLLQRYAAPTDDSQSS